MAVGLGTSVDDYLKVINDLFCRSKKLNVEKLHVSCFRVACSCISSIQMQKLHFGPQTF
jgi:hypothetical protein